MTVDTSRSCLGLGTCVGSMIRQIVEARVLLTATAPPALPGRSVSDGSLAPPVNGSHAFSDQLAVTVICRAMAQTKPINSRAIAVVTTLAGLPVRASLRYRAHNRTCPFQAMSRIGLGWFSCRSSNSRLIRAGKRELQAASINKRRAAELPALVMPPRLTLAPLECSDGTNPR